MTWRGAHGPADVRTLMPRRGPGTVAQCATFMLAALRTGGKFSETALLNAVRDAGYTMNQQTFTQAIAWLRDHRGLRSKAVKPRGRHYWIEAEEAK